MLSLCHGKSRFSYLYWQNAMLTCTHLQWSVCNLFPSKKLFKFGQRCCEQQWEEHKNRFKSHRERLMIELLLWKFWNWTQAINVPLRSQQCHWNWYSAWHYRSLLAVRKINIAHLRIHCSLQQCLFVCAQNKRSSTWCFCMEVTTHTRRGMRALSSVSRNHTKSSLFRAPWHRVRYHSEIAKGKIGRGDDHSKSLSQSHTWPNENALRNEYKCSEADIGVARNMKQK